MSPRSKPGSHWHYSKIDGDKWVAVQSLAIVSLEKKCHLFINNFPSFCCGTNTKLLPSILTFCVNSFWILVRSDTLGREASGTALEAPGESVYQEGGGNASLLYNILCNNSCNALEGKPPSF